jgi:hypothetical protein
VRGGAGDDFDHTHHGGRGKNGRQAKAARELRGDGTRWPRRGTDATIQEDGGGTRCSTDNDPHTSTTGDLSRHADGRHAIDVGVTEGISTRRI